MTCKLLAPETPQPTNTRAGLSEWWSNHWEERSSPFRILDLNTVPRIKREISTAFVEISRFIVINRDILIIYC